MYTEYSLGISRKHSKAEYIGLDVCSETYAYELGKYDMKIAYIDFWADDKQLKKICKKIEKYNNLNYFIIIKEGL